MRLRDIHSRKWVGDAYHDGPLLEAIDAYVGNKRTRRWPPVEGHHGKHHLPTCG